MKEKNAQNKNIWDNIGNLKQDESGNLTWDEFQGSQNSKDILMTKALTLSRVLVDISAGYIQLLQGQVQKAKEIKNLSEDYKKHLENVDKDKLNSLGPEFLYFFMHMVDRITFALLGDEKRSSFMNYLYMDVAHEYFKVTTGLDNPFAGIGSWFGEEYNKRQNEYLRYKIMLPENFKITTPMLPKSFEKCKDTLFGEFSKKIEKLLLGNNEDDLGFGCFADVILVNIILAYQFLALPKLLKEK